MRAGNIFLKIEQNKEFTVIYCSRCVSMIENHISGNLYIEIFSESSEEKCTFKVQFDPLLFIKMLLKTAQLFSKHFPLGLSLCILYLLFHTIKDTSAIHQPSVHYLVYVFLIFFCFLKCFNNFYISFLHIFTSMTQGVVSFSLK